jgi:uroporphyrinogen decarboxylase
LRYVSDAASEVRRALAGSVPLIGFAGSPYTLACYMVEGGASDDFRTIKTMLYREPRLLHRILEVNAQAVAMLLNAQIEAGAQAVMIFDTWGGSLSGRAYREFSLRYMEQALALIRREHDGAVVPRIVFTKGGGLWLEAIAKSGCDCVGLDWTIALGDARRQVGAQVSLQGNLDPFALFATPEAIRSEVATLLESNGAGTGHVFNLGHGISQFTPPENVAELVRAVHEISAQYHPAR